MTTQEIEMCREVQKTAETGIKTIEALTDMVQDDALSMQLARQTLRYSELYQEAARELLNAKAEGYRSTVIEDAKRRAEIHYHTLLNTSTAHLAELIMRGSMNGILEMEKGLKRHENISTQTEKLARQMIAMEQKNLLCLKQYL